MTALEVLTIKSNNSVRADFDHGMGTCLNCSEMDESKKLFEIAKKALASNPTEGQVEQSVVLPILKKLGYKNNQIFSKVTVRVKAGSKKFESLQCDLLAKDDVLPTLIIEAKSPKVGLSLPEDYNQGMSYCLSPDVKTRFLFLTSGYSTRFYDANLQLFKLDLKDLFFNTDKIRDVLLGKSTVKKSDESTSSDIEKFFTFSHNRMYAEDAIKPAEALHILTKLTLIKTNEERGKNLYSLKTILDYEKGYLETSNVEKRNNIEDEIFKYLSDCLESVDTDLLQPEEKTISRNLSVSTLFEIIKKLNSYTLDSIPVEKKGSAFDSFLNTTLKGKELGQFFTHRNIVNFVIDMTGLKLSDKVADPACGTGGFIEKAFLLLRAMLDDTFTKESKEYKEKLTQLQTRQIFGIEKDGNVASLSKLSMSMNGDGHTTIYKGNGLVFTNENLKEDEFDVILTNPPFGSKSVVKITNTEILQQFDLGFKHKFDKEQQIYEKTGEILGGQDIGVLFLERCIKLLKPNGTLGIILPDGIFSNSTNHYVRQYIRQHCRILSITKLSEEAFKPYSDGGGVETSVLICKKEQEKKSDKGFFGVAEKIGYRYKQKKILEDDNHLPELFKGFKNKKSTKSSKWISLSTIPTYERLDPQYLNNKMNLDSDKFEELGKYLKDNALLFGFSFKSEYFGKGDKHVIKIAHLNNSLLDKNKFETIPLDYFDKCDAVQLQEGDILLGMDGKKEFRASYVDKTVTNVTVNQRVAIIRIDDTKISSAYVFLTLVSKIGQMQLFGSKTQTATVAHLSGSIIKKIMIPKIDNKSENEIKKNFDNYVKTVRNTETVFDKISTSF
jgi:type I restriction-modification system DNA methylase subunit